MTEIDFAILDFIRTNMRCGFLDAFFSAVTHIGDGGIVASIIAIVLICTKKYRRTGCAMAFALVMCLVFGNLILKELVARPRPFIQNQDIRLLISPPSGYSFPSGHSYGSFAAATVLSKRHGKIAPYVIVLAFIIAFSRLYLYVHFPSDVIVGIIMGTVLGLVSCALVKEKENVTVHEELTDDKQ